MQSEEFQAVGYCREIESERVAERERDSREGESFWKEVIMGRLGTPSVWYPWENGLRTLSLGRLGCGGGGNIDWVLGGWGIWELGLPRPSLESGPLWIIWTSESLCRVIVFDTGLPRALRTAAGLVPVPVRKTPAVDLSDTSVFLSLTVYWTCS